MRRRFAHHENPSLRRSQNGILLPIGCFTLALQKTGANRSL